MNRNSIAYIVPMGKGLESFVFREVEYLLSRGMRLVLFSTKFKKNDIYSPREGWEYYTFGILRFLVVSPVIVLRALLNLDLLRHAVLHGTLVELIFALYYAPLMRRCHAEKIHCHFGDRKLFIGYYCKRLLGIPLSVTIHSHELHVNPNERMFRVALRACDRIFAISNLAINLLVNKFGAPPDRVMLSRLFLDLDAWSAVAPVRILMVGRFEPQKGHEYLFHAIRLLDDLDIEFVVVGFGDLDVRALAEQIGVSDRVVFFDKLGQEQLRLLYQSCDICCLPSTRHPEQGMEGIPVVLMEAMACGMPVVATDAGAVNEIVEQILVAEKSSQELADAIRRLALSQNLRLELGRRNREIVERQYSRANVELFAEELEKVKLVAGPSDDS